MARIRGYGGYRGRKPLWKVLAAIGLVLVILAAVVLMVLQRYMVYDASGTPHLHLPGKEQEAVSSVSGEDPDGIRVTIDEPEFAGVHGLLLQKVRSEVDAAAAESEEGYNTVAVTLKDASGAQRPDWAQDASLKALLDGDTYSVARLACLRDGPAARGDAAGMGLQNTGGYLFYDGNSENYLDPGKTAAREYLTGLVTSAAELGFDEIVLSDVGYPTYGKISKIAYGEIESPSAAVEALLREIKAALPKGVALGVEVPASLLTDGADETAGLDLTALCGIVNSVYAPVKDSAEADTFAAAVKTAAGARNVRFVALLKKGAEALPEGEFLISAD